MPSARQLLEQADALMRRNRKRGKGKGNGPPTLTDALTKERTGTLAPTIILPEAASSADPIVPGSAPPADPIALDTLSDVPVLTDVVDTWETQAEVWPPVVPDPEASALAEALDDALATPEATEGDATATAERDAAAAKAVDTAPSEALDVDVAVTGNDKPPEHDVPAGIDPDVGDRPTASVDDGDEATPAARHRIDSATTPATESTIAAAMGLDRTSNIGRETPPHAAHDEEFILDIPPATEPLPAATEDKSAASAAPVAAIPQFVPGSAAWEAMAEEIRMQVLQRLDLFTDTGMRDQLGARLQPIVARASAELVETINHALGELVRGYVAEAIEREIESWRKRDG
ncbi:MAG TPA: hypothetical protein VJX31_11105 [Casimicrobiaceae bacterium]|nr:hypothetical protein [Casimicrobiaceae bacterium]